MKNWIVKFLLLPLCIVIFTQCQSEKINWMTWEEAEKVAMQNQDKKVLVWLYDESCNTCADAEKANFSNHRINKYINEKFYTLKFEAHRTTPVKTKGNDYTLRDDGVHELAVSLTGSTENITFPKLIFLNENMDLIVPMKGVLALDDFEVILAFVSENRYEQMTIDEFRKTYKPK